MNLFNKYLFILVTILSTIIFGSNNISEFMLKENSDKLIKINFELSNLDFQSKNGFTEIISNSKGETSVIGMPKLPEFSTLVNLNPTKKYEFFYDVNESYVVENIDIIPNQKIKNGLEINEVIDLDENL